MTCVSVSCLAFLPGLNGACERVRVFACLAQNRGNTQTRKPFKIRYLERVSGHLRVMLSEIWHATTQTRAHNILIYLDNSGVCVSACVF